ncbi:MAG: hypothetical protein ABL879_04085 [Devosia sp.]
MNDDWVVQPHGELIELDKGLFTVAGEIVMPLGRFPRRMTIAVLAGRGLALWSPIPLADKQMIELEKLGNPTFLIVPGVSHRLDIRAWKQRYASAAVICAPGAREAVEEAIPVDAVGDVLGDAAVRMETAPGVGEKEAILWVKRAAGVTLVVNDILANVRHPHGIGAQVMARLLGFGVDRPRMPKIGKRLFLKDPKALAAGFRQWAKTDGLRRIVVSHGDPITDPVPVLKRAADELDRMK